VVKPNGFSKSLPIKSFTSLDQGFWVVVVIIWQCGTGSFNNLWQLIQQDAKYLLKLQFTESVICLKRSKIHTTVCRRTSKWFYCSWVAISEFYHSQNALFLFSIHVDCIFYLRNLLENRALNVHHELNQNQEFISRFKQAYTLLY
jgi:hypothetical protein